MPIDSIDSIEAKRIAEELHKKRIFEDQKIDTFLKSTGKISTNLDWIRVLNFMINDKFSYIFYIGKKIVDCATADSEYVALIAKLSHNDKFMMDLAKLIDLYDKNQSVAEFVLKKLFEIIDERTAIAIGYILGGMGHSKPKDVFKIINLSTQSNPHKIAFLFGLQITAEKQKLPRQYLEYIISGTKSDNSRIKQISINTLAWRFNNVKRIQDILTHLAKKDDYHKGLMAQVAGTIRSNEKLAMKLLLECSKTDNANVADTVALSLGRLAPKFSIECLKILKKWTRNSKFTHRSYSSWFIEEIGKGDLQKIEDFVLDWITSEKNYIIITFHLPDIIYSIYENQEQGLIQLLKRLDYKKSRLATLILKILEKYLSEGFRKTHRSETFIVECNSLLVKISSHQSLDTQLDANINNPVIQTLALIHAIEVKEKTPDTSLAIKNLDKFPNVISFFGKQTLIDLIQQKPKHPLVWYIANASVSKSQITKKINKMKKVKTDFQKSFIMRSARDLAYPFSMLTDIDVSLAMIGKKEQGRSRLKDGLLDERDFYQTLIELNVISRIKKKYNVLMQPKFGKNRLDAQFNIDSKDYLMEIYSPKEDIRLEYIRTAHGMDNKAKKSILTKVNSQINSTTGLNLPVILVIDKTMARSIGEEDIIDSLYGTFQFTWVMDKKTGKTVRSYASRAGDSLSKVSPHGNLISAVILLSREFDGNDFRIKLYGKIYPNPNALVPITDTVIKKIEETIFGKGIF